MICSWLDPLFHEAFYVRYINCCSIPTHSDCWYSAWNYQACYSDNYVYWTLISSAIHRTLLNWLMSDLLIQHWHCITLGKYKDRQSSIGNARNDVHSLYTAPLFIAHMWALDNKVPTIYVFRVTLEKCNNVLLYHKYVSLSVERNWLIQGCFIYDITIANVLCTTQR